MELFDQYAQADSPVHRLDARAKLPALVLAALAVALTPRGSFLALGLLGGLALALAVATRIPLLWLLSRALPVVPLAALSLLSALFVPPASPEDAIVVCGRLSASVSALVWAASASLIALIVVVLTMTVIATSGAVGFLAAMRRLGAPPVLVTTMQFALRYVATIGDEARRMMRARDLRGRPRRVATRARVAGAIVGSLFIRSAGRAMRVAHAMAARGFSGDLPTLAAPPLRARDVVACLCVVALFWGVALAARGGVF